MRLSDFIRSNNFPIIEEWEIFVKTSTPAAEGISPLSLRNHIRGIPKFIFEDIDCPQTDEQQKDKVELKKGKAPGQSAAEIHANLRQAGGFNMDQMVSEYRALRASVVKLWKAQLRAVDECAVSDLIRCNEAIDQELTEPIFFYTKTLDHSRDLFLAIVGHDLRNPVGKEGDHDTRGQQIRRTKSCRS